MVCLYTVFYIISVWLLLLVVFRFSEFNGIYSHTKLDIDYVDHLKEQRKEKKTEINFSFLVNSEHDLFSNLFHFAHRNVFFQ